MRLMSALKSQTLTMTLTASPQMTVMDPSACWFVQRRRIHPWTP